MTDSGQPEKIKGTGSFPAWWDILGILLVFFLAGILGGKLAAIIPAFRGGFPIFAGYFVQLGVAIAYALVIQKRRTGTLRGTMKLSIHGINPRIVFWGVVMTVAIGVVIEPLLELFPSEYLDTLGDVMNSGGWAMLTSIVAAPIMEETLFRGILQEGLSKRYGAWPGIFLAALIFGVVHIIPQQVVAASITGILLGYIYYRTGSLLSVVFVHAANNAFAHFSLILTGDMTTTTREMAGSDKAYFTLYALCAFLVIWSVVSISVRTARGNLRPLGKRPDVLKKEEPDG